MSRIALERYLGAPAAGLLSLAARGVWAEVARWMWAESPQRGRLLHATGAAVSVGQLARLLGAAEGDVSHLVCEAVDVGLLAWEGDALVCPAMAHDAMVSAARREAGRAGGLAKQVASLPKQMPEQLPEQLPRQLLQQTGETGVLPEQMPQQLPEHLLEQNPPPASSPLHPPSSSPLSSPPSESPQGATPCVVVVAIPLADGTDFLVGEEQVAEWEGAFPRVDVRQALRQIREWNLSNPRKRKTARGVRTHVTGWLGQIQNTGRGPLAVGAVETGAGGRPSGPVTAARL